MKFPHCAKQCSNFLTHHHIVHIQKIRQILPLPHQHSLHQQLHHSKEVHVLQFHCHQMILAFFLQGVCMGLNFWVGDQLLAVEVEVHVLF